MAAVKDDVKGLRRHQRQKRSVCEAFLAWMG
jgi:hypothetical protein